MTETHDPAERPGQHSNRRPDCPDWCESNHDRNDAHIRQLSTSFDDPVRAALIRSTRDGRDRIMLAPNDYRQGWHGFFVEVFEADDLAGMLDTFGAHDAANDVRQVVALRQPKVDGPRADAPVEVVAEAPHGEGERCGDCATDEEIEDALAGRPHPDIYWQGRSCPVVEGDQS